MDYYIQELFEKQEIFVVDHHHTNQSHRRLVQLIRERAHREHNMLLGWTRSGGRFKMFIQEEDWKHIQDAKFHEFDRGLKRKEEERVKALREKEIKVVNEAREGFMKRSVWFLSNDGFYKLYFEGEVYDKRRVPVGYTDEYYLEKCKENICEGVYEYPDWYFEDDVINLIGEKDRTVRQMYAATGVPSINE